MRAVDADGQPLPEGGAPIENSVNLADLALQPLDLVLLIGKKIEATAFSELESRVRYHFARQHSLDDSAIVKIGWYGGRAFIWIGRYCETGRG